MRQLRSFLFLSLNFIFLTGAGQKLPQYDVIVQPDQLQFHLQAESGSESARLNLYFDRDLVISSLCGEKSWALHIAQQYQITLKKASKEVKRVRLTGSQLCTLSDNEKTVRIQIVNE